jgi:hypothetical protein
MWTAETDQVFFVFQVILEFVWNFFWSFQTNQIEVVVYVKGLFRFGPVFSTVK